MGDGSGGDGGSAVVGRERDAGSGVVNERDCCRLPGVI